MTYHILITCDWDGCDNECFALDLPLNGWVEYTERWQTPQVRSKRRYHYCPTCAEKAIADKPPRQTKSYGLNKWKRTVMKEKNK